MSTNFNAISNSRWIVLNAESGAHLASFQDGDRALTDIKYSLGWCG